MNLSLTPNSTVMLPSILDLRAAEPLKAELLAARGQSVNLDASAVERLGGVCLQLLLSAVRTWRADGQVLTFVNVSEAMNQQWIGLGAPLNDLQLQDAPQ